MINILITGGSGFIGSRLLSTLSKNAKIYAIFRHKPNQKIPLLNLIISDLTNYNSLQKSLSHINKIDIIIHLASVTENSNDKFSKNDLMIKNLIKLAKHKSTHHFIFISSNAVNYSSRPYALSKKSNENILINSGLKFTVLRPTLVVGRGSKDLQKIRKYLNLGPIIPVPGGNESFQSPIYVDDLVNLIIKLVNYSPKNEIISVGGPDKLNTLELLNILSQTLDQKKYFLNLPSWLISWINPNLLKAFYTDISIKNSSNFQKDLNWYPRKITSNNILN